MSTPKIKARAQKEREGGRLLQKHVHTRKTVLRGDRVFLGFAWGCASGEGRGRGRGLRIAGLRRRAAQVVGAGVGGRVGVATRIQTGCQSFARINSVHPRLALRVLEDSRTFVATFQRSTVTRH